MSNKDYKDGYFAPNLFEEEKRVGFRKPIEDLIKDYRGEVSEPKTGSILLDLKGQNEKEFLAKLTGVKKEEIEIANWGFFDVKNEVSYHDKLHETSRGIMMPTVHLEFENSIVSLGITTSESGMKKELYFHIENKR